MKFSLPLTYAAVAFTMMSLPAVSAANLWKDLVPSTGSTKNSTSIDNLRRRMPSVPISPNCNPDDAFMIFNGHNQATSATTGNVVISWSPPFVATYADERFIYCGGFTYYIFTSKHESEDVFLERVNDKSISELVAMANADPDDDFFLDVTTDLSLEWKRFTPGIDYTMLVTAATNEGVLSAQGIESMNREPARLKVSSVVPKLRTNVNGRKLTEGESPVIEVPNHETDTFATKVITYEGIDEYTVIFHDDSPLPNAIEQIQEGLYFYADGVSKIGSADLVKCVYELDVSNDLPIIASNVTGSFNTSDVTGTYVKAFSVVKGDLGDIFEELDASADFFDDTNEIAESTEELSQEEDEEVENFLEGLDQEALLNLCISSNPDLENKEEECLADITSQFEEEVLAGNGGRKLRRLRCCRRFRRRMKKVGRKIKSTAKAVAKAVKDALDIRIVLKDTTLTLIDIDAGGRMTCESEVSGSEGAVGVQGSTKTEIGVNLDFSAHMRFGITVKTLSGVEKAHASLFGGFGAKSYLMFQSTHKITFQPDPYVVFKKSSNKVFMAGPVPVIITIRPSVSAFAEAAMVIESDVLLEGKFGYDWEFGFSYHKDTGTHTVSKFEKRTEDKRPPVFDLRLNAAAEMGLTFAVDVVLYGVLQGTLAADTGFGAEVEVTVNAAALFDENQQDLYNLQKAELEAFIRIRGFVGLNQEIGDVIRDVTKDLNNKGDTRSCEWKFAKYRVPELPSRDDPDLMAEALEAARNLNFEEIDVNGILDSLGDNYSPDRGELEGQNLGFGKNFKIFSVDFMLLDLVRDNGPSCASLTCNPVDECTDSRCVDGVGCIAKPKDCGHDSQCVVGRGCVSNHALSLCAGGTLSAGFHQCCGECNGLCGGRGCAKRPGGANKCCNGRIHQNGKICEFPFDTGCMMPQ